MDFAVLIVGTGPSGATTALHLARLGVKSLVISRHRGSANTPRAHIFNQRAMEVLRDAELEEVLAPIASPAHGKLLFPFFLSQLSFGMCLNRIFVYVNRYATYFLASQPCR